MSNKQAIYKYNAKVKHRKWREYAICFIPFMIFLIVLLIRPIMPVFIGGFIISLFIGVVLLSKHNNIAIFPRFFVMGDTVILYRNVKRLMVKGGSDIALLIETNSGQQYKLEMKRFTSNARKSWKIENNKKTKFNRVVGKILKKCAESSEKISITIQNYPELKSFRQN